MVIRPSRGFTLIELIAVMAIVATLVAISLPVISLLRQSARKAQTASLVSAVATAIATASQRGLAPPIVPHPLAGSADLPRLAFVRGEAVGGYAVGAAVATTGESLQCAAPATLTGSPDRLILASDRFSGIASGVAVQPLLYGLRRDQMTILGSAAGLERYRRLPPVGAAYDQNGDGMLDTPYDSTRYPDNRFLVQDASALTSIDTQTKTVFETVFAAGDLQDLVAKRSAITTTSGSTLLNGRLYATADPSATAWSAGRVWNGSAWVGYRLRGLALYDAWGRELLVSIDAAGAVTVTSAGPDGVFRWHPGDDGVFQTAPADAAPSGDDRDGSLDNIRSR